MTQAVIAGRLMHFTEEFEALPLTYADENGARGIVIENVEIPDDALLSFEYFPPPPVLKSGPVNLSVQILSKTGDTLISHDYKIDRQGFVEIGNYFREKWQIFYNYIDFYRHFKVDLSAAGGQVVDIHFRIKAPDADAEEREKYEKWSGSRMPTAFAVCNPVIYSKEPIGKKINILFVVVDAMRADSVGAYGYARPTTPSIDRIAAQGLTLLKAYSPTNFTRGSVTSIFSGRYPSTLGIPLARWDLTDEEKKAFRLLTSYDLSEGAFPDSLPRRLAGKGYVVEHIGSDPFIQDGTDIGVSLGFSRNASFNQRRRDTEAIADQSLEFIEQNATRPFFLTVHFNNGHGPLRPPKRFQGVFNNEIVNDPRIWPEDYDGEIRYADEKIGLMMDALRSFKIEDNTLVVICADHGQGFEVGHPKGHAHSLYDGEVRVPFIMRLPGRLPAGTKYKGLVSLLDFYPTFLTLADGKTPNDFAGVNLLEQIQNTDHARELYLEGAGIRALARYYEKIIVKDGPYERMNGLDPADKGRFAEYYALPADFHETDNMADLSSIYQRSVFASLRQEKITRARTRFEQGSKLSELMEGAGTLYSESAHESVELVLNAGRKAGRFQVRMEFAGKPDSVRCFDCLSQDTIAFVTVDQFSDATAAMVDLNIEAGQSRLIGFTPWPPDDSFEIMINCDGRLLDSNRFRAGPFQLPFIGNPAQIGGLNDYMMMKDAKPPELDPETDFGAYIRYIPALTKAQTGMGGQVKDALRSWGYVK